MLSKYLNASAVCSKMTDAEKLYNRAMLLMKDANEEAYLAASDCLTSAAMRNHTGAQLELGKLYEKGKGVNASNIFAYKWLQTAVLLGNKDAIPYRDELESRMDLDDIAMASPMIQSTLDLIDQYEQHRAKEIEEFEKTIAGEYNKFGAEDWIEGVRCRCGFRGYEIGKKYAEAFEILRMEMSFDEGSKI